MKPEVRGQLADSIRPWMSLAITIHFFALIVSLAANLSPSELQRRILKVMTPYTVGLRQNYPGVPLEMTRGTEIDYPCKFEIRRAGAQDWETIAPPPHLLSALDGRWRSFERMTSIIATEQNESLVQLLFEQCVRQADLSGGESTDAVRLSRRAALSYTADQAFLAGELPKSESEDRSLFECRVVRLGQGGIRLVPVLESMRTSKSALQGEVPEDRPVTSATSSPPAHGAPVDKVPVEARP